MTTDPSAGEAAHDDAYVQYGKVGGPVRMAVLHFMAKHPEGAPLEKLHREMRAAIGNDYMDFARAQQVIRGMQRDNLVARERVTPAPGQTPYWRWYSPASRQAAIARGTWRPDQAKQSTSPTPNH